MTEMNRKNSIREVTGMRCGQGGAQFLFQAVSGAFLFTAESSSQLGLIQSLMQRVTTPLYFGLRLPEPYATHPPHI